MRAELDAVMAAPFDANGYAAPDPFRADGTVTVTVTPVRGGVEQQVAVQAVDPRDRSHVVAQAVALKAQALQGGKKYEDGVRSDVMLGCPPR